MKVRSRFPLTRARNFYFIIYGKKNIAHANEFVVTMSVSHDRKQKCARKVLFTLFYSDFFLNGRLALSFGTFC